MTTRPSWLLPTPPRTDEPDHHAIAAGDVDLRRATLRLMRGENLTRPEAREFLSALLSPAATDAQIAGALASLAVKGETVEELAGMAETMRDRAVRVRAEHSRFIDTAGTGSSAVKTFNVSTAAAFVIAGAGLAVAKHGSRAATSRCGSADVLESLGVNTAASAQTVERCLNKHGICFMFAPLFHGATARVAQVRRELGVHTTFNLLGPLTNPARAPFQLLGVWHPALLEQVASALSLLGIEKGWVVHGADGLDEITLTGETFVAACSGKSDSGPSIETFTIAPQDFGLDRRSLDDLHADGPVENAQLIRAILRGERKGNLALARDLVIANAAAALHIAALAPDLRTAADMARESVDNGAAASKLDVLVRETTRDK
jgi:anthranilate phosphoribosyltransferase